MDKAAEAFRNIGEVSDELGVRKHVLRFWEMKFPQLKPMKRGGGRRLYRPSDVELLRGIRHLLQNAGYTIKGVQRILRERGIDAVKSSGSARIVGVAGSGKSRSAASPAAAEGSVLLSSLEVDALRAVMAELDACRVLLSHANGGDRHCEQAAKR
ncbi:MAG TPA: MerR family transcriptional regulator [Hyphomicrobiaceae bacterium]|nr:MerR family transcriptional regulator [Hyphomicrobiaceae bacterium]